MGGARHDISRCIDSKCPYGCPPTIQARLGDEDCGEARVGGGDVGGRIAQEPAGGGGVTRPQEDGARGGGRGGGESGRAGGAGNRDPITGGEGFVLVGGRAGVDPEDLVGGAEREPCGGAGTPADDQVTRKGHRVEGDLAPRCAGVPVESAAVDVSDEGETATHTGGGDFGEGVAAGIGDAGAEVGVGGDRTSIGNHGRQPEGV